LLWKHTVQPQTDWLACFLWPGKGAQRWLFYGIRVQMVSLHSNWSSGLSHQHTGLTPL